VAADVCQEESEAAVGVHDDVPPIAAHFAFCGDDFTVEVKPWWICGLRGRRQRAPDLYDGRRLLGQCFARLFRRLDLLDEV
jgi:hypothetical protein